MKKYILGAVLSLGIFIFPIGTQAAGLTEAQSTSLIAVVQASPGTPASAFVNLITAFSSITATQATSLINVVQSSPSTSASAFVPLLTSFTGGSSTDQSTTQTTTTTTTTVIPTTNFSSASTPQSFGARGDCVSDDTVALQAFFKVGGYLSAPSGGCYKITDTIYIPSNISVTGAGKSALIQFLLPNGASARPALDLSGSGTRTTSGISLSNFALDGGTSVVTMTAPTVYNSNIGAAEGILVQSSNTNISNIWVSNAWDNGIGLYQFGCTNSGTTNSQCNGYPTNISVSSITCSNNGRGSLTGSCVDVLTATNATVSDSTDEGSGTGFIADYWGGASGTFSNLTANNTLHNGFYIGSSNFTLKNLKSYNAGDNALWIDWYAAGTGTVDGFLGVNPQHNGMFVQASGWTIKNSTITGANQSNGSNLSAYRVDQPTGPVTGTSFTNATPNNELRSFYPGKLTLKQGERAGDAHLSILMQTDGDLAVYVDGKMQWSSHTYGQCTDCQASYQTDGNLVISNQGNSIWNSASTGSSLLFVSDRSPFVSIRNRNGVDTAVLSSGTSLAPASTVGTYRVYLNGSQAPSIATNNISRNDATTNCMNTQNSNPSSSIRCTWEGAEIYSFTPSITPAEPTFTPSCIPQSNGTYSVTMNWSPVSGATNYPVRLLDPNNKETDIGDGSAGSPITGTSYTFAGLTVPGVYTTWMHAWNSAGWSPYTQKSVTCTAPASYVAPPSAPATPTVTSVTCTPQSNGTYSVTMNWQQVSGANSYPVRLKSPSGVETDIGNGGSGTPVAPINNNSGTNSYAFANLTAPGTYTVWMNAWSSAGGWSSNSNMPTVTCVAPVTTAPATPTVTSVTCTPQSNGTFSVTMNWSPVSGAESYPVRLKGPGSNGAEIDVGNGGVGTPVASTLTSYTFTNLTVGTYMAWMNAWNSAGGSSWSGNSNIGVVTCFGQTASALDAFNSATSPGGPQSQTKSTGSFRYAWNRDLQIGSPYSNDIIALQTVLTRERVYTGEITGGFYNQTYTAVKKLQKKYGIKQSGYVGMLTRAKLNTLYGE